MVKVDSVAALKRIPVGTKLYIIASLRGPNAPKGRIVQKVRSRDILFTVDDPTSKNHGETSYLGLDKVRVEPTANGFRIFDASGVRGEGGGLCAEYVFAEPDPEAP